VVKLFDKIEQLEKHLKELQETNEKISEKVSQNSQNSNNPPTSEPLNVEIPKKKGNRSGGTKSDNLKVMEEKQLLETAEIDENDWEQTPVSVRNLVVKLFDKIEQL
jgi:hypothetical protein